MPVTSDCAAIPKLQGLTLQEVRERLEVEGFNELEAAKSGKFLTLLLDILREPMLLLLVGAATVYVLLGDPIEAAAILAATFLIIAITLFQQQRTERALQALKDLSAPRALVIREGQRKRIPGRDVVRGDLVVIAEGDRVAADGVLLEGNNVLADESLLTGESVPVHKSPSAQSLTMARPGGENSPFVFAGTMIIRGAGIAEIKATGSRTELGRIGKGLSTLSAEPPRLQREVRQLTFALAIVGIASCVLLALVYTHIYKNLLQGLLSGLTLAISMVPEEFPVVLMTFMALGAWRLSRQQVLTRRAPAIESLGATTALCVDKTGTLTLNRMSVEELCLANGTSYRLTQELIPEQFHELVEYAILASSSDPFDPMEKAFVELGSKYLGDSEHRHADWRMEREYPLTPQLMMMSRAWKPSNQAKGYEIATKGAPEAVLQSRNSCNLSRSEILQLATRMAARGLRVLAIAKAIEIEKLPDEQKEIDLDVVGLIGLADPIRPTAPEAINQCHSAGIRVLMMTGDYPETARNIAAQIGIPGEKVVNGPEISRMDDEALSTALREGNVFARVLPEQKLRIVQLLQSCGEVVAMTGDGVNDAPALKAADIGIAMGGRGTDVAREAASLVLLDDDFASIVGGIRLGRRIYDNIKKAMSYVFALHVPIAGAALIPVLAGWPPLLMPLHVVLLELVIDPACSIAFEAEPEDASTMRRPPRNPSQRLFTFRELMLNFFQGAVLLAATIGIYGGAIHIGHDPSDARALAFSTLVMGNIALMFVNRSSTLGFGILRGGNAALTWIAVIAFTLLAATLYIPPVRNLFQFSFLHLQDLALICAVAFLLVICAEALKSLKRTQWQPN